MKSDNPRLNCLSQPLTVVSDGLAFSHYDNDNCLPLSDGLFLIRSHGLTPPFGMQAPMSTNVDSANYKYASTEWHIAINLL